MQNGDVYTLMRPQDNQRLPAPTKVRIVKVGVSGVSGRWDDGTSPGTYPGPTPQVEIEVLETDEQATVPKSKLFDCKSNG